MNRTPRENERPTPYLWVPIAKATPQPLVSHERWDEKERLTLRVTLEFHVISEYLHVGSGRYQQVQGRICHAFARRAGSLIIPGSSWKGAVRAMAEALSFSCVSQGGRACQPVRRGHASLCPACLLFGAPGYRGRILAEDAEPKSPPSLQALPIGELWRPSRSQGRKLYRHLLFPGPAFGPNRRWLEVVPKGTVFKARMRMDCVTPAEIALILHAMGLQVQQNGLEPAFPLKIGGGRPRCLGSVHIIPTRLEIWDPTRLRWQPQPLETLSDWWNKKSLIREDVWDQLLKNLDGTRDGSRCPAANY